MHITRVTLKNFTAYRELDIRLSRGLNIIVGHSNVGKSQFLKALRWVLVNDVSYKDVRRIEDEVPTTATEARLEFSTGVSVTRRQSNSENSYILRSPDGTQQVFEKVGRGVVPEEVQRATGVFYQLNGAPINFAKQRGAAFLVDETPRDRVVTLSELSPLMTAFEEAAGEAQREGKRRAREAKLKDGEIQAVSQRLEALGDLEQFERIIQAGEKAKRQAEETAAGLAALDEYLQAQESWERLAAETADRLSWGESLCVLFRQEADKASALDDKLAALTAFMDAQKACDALESPETGVSLRERLSVQEDALRAVEAKMAALKGYAVARRDEKAAVADAEEKTAALTARREEILKQEGVCPLCRRPQ